MKRKVLCGMMLTFFTMMFFSLTVFAAGLNNGDSYKLTGIRYHDTDYDIGIVRSFIGPITGDIIVNGDNTAVVNIYGTKDNASFDDRFITTSWGKKSEYKIVDDNLLLTGNDIIWIFTKNDSTDSVAKDKVTETKDMAAQPVNNVISTEESKDTPIENVSVTISDNTPEVQSADKSASTAQATEAVTPDTNTTATPSKKSSLAGKYTMTSISNGKRTQDASKYGESLIINDDNTGLVYSSISVVPVVVTGNNLVDTEGNTMPFTASGNNIVINYRGLIMTYTKS